MDALTVYASGGGHRYHSRWSCPALVAGQLMSDYDCDEDCRHDHPSIHPALDYGVAEMVEAGRTPCRVCAPPLAPAEDFGHVPVPAYEVWVGVAEQVCARCGGRTGAGTEPWPCASAVVLGLTPTT